MTKAEYYNEWRAANPDKMREYYKKYYEKNKAKINERKRESRIEKRMAQKRFTLGRQEKNEVARRLIAHARRLKWQQFKKDYEYFKNEALMKIA